MEHDVFNGRPQGRYSGRGVGGGIVVKGQASLDAGSAHAANCRPDDEQRRS